MDAWLADLKAYAGMTQLADVTTSKVVYLGFESLSPHLCRADADVGDIIIKKLFMRVRAPHPTFDFLKKL